MLLRDKKVLPTASLITSFRLPESLLAARFFDPSAVLPTSVSTSKSRTHFTNPTRTNFVLWVCAHLFTVLGLTQPHESLYAQSLA